MGKLYKARTAFHTEAPKEGKQRTGTPTTIRAGDIAEAGSWPVVRFPNLFEPVEPDYPAPEQPSRKQEKHQESRKSGE